MSFLAVSDQGASFIFHFISYHIYEILLFLNHGPADAQQQRYKLHLYFVRLPVIQSWTSWMLRNRLIKVFLMHLIMKLQYQY